jgi:ATP synthase protein I
VALGIESKPIRTVLRWQLYASLVLALVAGLWQGHQGAVSALLGGLVNVTAGLFFGWIVSRRSKGATAGEILRTLFRAEAGKVILIVIQLWLVLSIYKDVVPLVFIGSFMVTVLIFSAAIFVRDN